jgi:hypothetical protein
MKRPFFFQREGMKRKMRTEDPPDTFPLEKKGPLHFFFSGKV